MRRFWVILLLILACNATSLVARISMLNNLTADLIQCYIDEQEEDYALTDNNTNSVFESSESIGVNASCLPASENNTSKNSTHINGKFSYAEYHQELLNTAFIVLHNESHNSLSKRAKDYYVYALRHIII